MEWDTKGQGCAKALWHVPLTVYKIPRGKMKMAICKAHDRFG